ncbi:MAG: hypothetical protein GY769_14700 [bacterium]|nr:hypothetical protein [bacterium]
MLRWTVFRGAALTLAICGSLGGMGGIGGIGGGALWAQEEAPLERIEFESAGIPGPNTIYLRGIGEDDAGGLLRLEIWANEVTDLYGLGLTIQFPKQLFRFPKSRSSVFVEGSFLSEDGDQDSVLLVRQFGKEIIIGHTRVGETAGVSGSGLLMTLEFRGLEVAGKKLFRLRRTRAFDSSGAVAEGYSWLTGKAIVTIPE